MCSVARSRLCSTMSVASETGSSWWLTRYDWSFSDTITTRRSAIVTGRSARCTMVALTRSLSAKRSIAVPRLADGDARAGVAQQRRDRGLAGLASPARRRPARTHRPGRRSPPVCPPSRGAPVRPDRHRSAPASRPGSAAPPPATSLARRNATSFGRCLALRRLCDRARRTASSTSFAMTRTMSCAICNSAVGQQRAVDLARQLVRQLGADGGGRLRQQTCNVGVRKG